MKQERWEQVKSLIKSKFKVLSEGQEKEEEKEIEKIEFISPLGQLKLEWIQKPRVLDIKTSHSAKRAGAVAEKIEKVLSKTEKVSYLKAYILKDEDWLEISPEKMEF